MRSHLSVIALRLPSAEEATPLACYSGERKMLTFWRSGDLDNLPKKTSVGLALNCGIRMTEPFGRRFVDAFVATAENCFYDNWNIFPDRGDIANP